jgi:hypothetical protein
MKVVDEVHAFFSIGLGVHSCDEGVANQNRERKVTILTLGLWHEALHLIIKMKEVAQPMTEYIQNIKRG